MPYIPTTDEDIQQMLDSVGLANLEDLFAEIPKNLRIQEQELNAIPSATNEMKLTRELKEAAQKDSVALNFIGAGAYEHYIPAAVWELAGRGEWLTSYTPYQAEASQGTLQLLYEYQSMMARLMQMEVANASLYDGASALAEAVLMAMRCRPHAEFMRILVPQSLHPIYQEVLKTIVQTQALEIVELPISNSSGRVEESDLEKYSQDTPNTISAVIIPQPNFFGVLEDIDMITEFAERKNALVIAVVNPISVAMLKPPGEWGTKGADIVCGEGQPLGIPLSSGGPYMGFLCCRKEHIRQLPGRLIGRTVDSEGKEGFTLTLQAREQHIRRGKATSNICTNQGLLVTAATIYLSLMGNEGLLRTALACHANTAFLRKKLNEQEKQNKTGIKILFADSPFFHETVIQLPVPVEFVMQKMTAQGIEPGFDLRPYYPELGESLLVCVTETKTKEDIDWFVSELQKAVQSSL
jgi:glycine dehydrogenase subunit 1